MAVTCQKVNSIDIKAAFLQVRELIRNVYIYPPPETHCKGTLWKLNKYVYGLVDASLYWYNKLKDTMQQLGGHVSPVDPAVFYWLNDGGELTGFLPLTVMIFFFCGVVLKHFPLWTSHTGKLLSKMDMKSTTASVMYRRNGNLFWKWRDTCTPKHIYKESSAHCYRSGQSCAT